MDSGEARLKKIVELIRVCRFSVHDLSRVKSAEPGEFARLNMPFELGIDYGMSIAGDTQLQSKKLLVIAEQKYLHHAALSDIAGWDIRSHQGEFGTAIKEVRAWLSSHGLAERSNSQIAGDYTGFQEWDYERLLAAEWTESDIQERGTREILDAMRLWHQVDRPSTFF